MNVFDFCTNTRRDRPHRGQTCLVLFYSAVSKARRISRRLLARPVSSHFKFGRRARVLLSFAPRKPRSQSLRLPGSLPRRGTLRRRTRDRPRTPALWLGPSSSILTTRLLHCSRRSHSVEVFVLENRKPAEKNQQKQMPVLRKDQ